MSRLLKQLNLICLAIATLGLAMALWAALTAPVAVLACIVGLSLAGWGCRGLCRAESQLELF